MNHFTEANYESNLNQFLTKLMSGEVRVPLREVE